MSEGPNDPATLALPSASDESGGLDLDVTATDGRPIPMAGLLTILALGFATNHAEQARAELLASSVRSGAACELQMQSALAAVLAQLVLAYRQLDVPGISEFVHDRLPLIEVAQAVRDERGRLFQVIKRAMRAPVAPLPGSTSG